MDRAERNRAIVALRDQGMSLKRIAATIGCSGTTVDTALRAAGRTKRTWEDLTPEQRADRDERIVELFDSGKSHPEIAEAAKCSERTVQRVLADAGRVDHGAARPRPYAQEVWDRVEAFLREEEAPYTAAAEIFGISVDAISSRFPELGWRRPDAAAHAGAISAFNRKFAKVTYANN